MVQCPSCEKVQLVYIQGPESTSCHYCDARWVQSGEEQHSIIEPGSPSFPQPLRASRTTTEVTR